MRRYSNRTLLTIVVSCIADVISRVEGAQMKESNVLALRKGARRPLLYAVDLNLLYVNPPVVAGVESLVYGGERALTDETLIERQDLLVAIDDYDVAQVRCSCPEPCLALPVSLRRCCSLTCCAMLAWMANLVSNPDGVS